ncbi:MAG: rhodanese-like domain-containing protein [Candidatus Xenobia bacterium]
MSDTIDLRGLDQLMTEGAQLVEVLPAGQYEDEHIPGAISLPLDSFQPHQADAVSRVLPVIVYCYDYQ